MKTEHTRAGALDPSLCPRCMAPLPVKREPVACICCQVLLRSQFNPATAMSLMAARVRPSFRPWDMISHFDLLGRPYYGKKYLDHTLTIKVCEQVLTTLEALRKQGVIPKPSREQPPTVFVYQGPEKAGARRCAQLFTAIHTGKCWLCTRKLDKDCGQFDVTLPVHMAHSSGAASRRASFYEFMAQMNNLTIICSDCNLHKGILEYRGTRMLRSALFGINGWMPTPYLYHGTGIGALRPNKPVAWAGQRMTDYGMKQQTSCAMRYEGAREVVSAILNEAAVRIHSPCFCSWERKRLVWSEKATRSIGISCGECMPLGAECCGELVVNENTIDGWKRSRKRHKPVDRPKSRK